MAIIINQQNKGKTRIIYKILITLRMDLINIYRKGKAVNKAVYKSSIAVN